MTIPITTRSGKGSPLTDSEVDTNWTNLARNSSQTVQGNVEMATTAEAQTGTALDLAISPATFVDAYNQQITDLAKSITGNGHMTFSGGLIIQWGSESYAAQQVQKTTAVSFSLTFPTAALQVYMSPSSNIDSDTNNYALWAVPGPASTTGFNGHVTGETAPHQHDGFQWIAIGH